MNMYQRNMKHNDKTNVVGRIIPEEIFIIENIQPGQKFKLKEVTGRD